MCSSDLFPSHDKKAGVLPQYDIRTDRFDIAVDTMDKGSKAKIARREQTIAERAKEGMEKEKANEKQVGGPESTQATPGGSGS